MQDAQRTHGSNDSRLVVTRARTDTAVADNSVGSLRHCSMREYRVHVGDEQNMALTRARQCSDNIVPNGGRYPWYALDLGTQELPFKLPDHAPGGPATHHHRCAIK